MFKEYGQYDATGLAQLVRDRKVSAAELLDAALARAEAVNPKLNAIIIAMHEVARARAAETLSGPFAGVPFLAKDLFQDVAGVPTAYGCKALKAARYVPPANSEIVNRWLKAGVVIFGKTNTPEFGAKAITEPEAWGPTRNPWNLAHVPGGSSGGSAAAVASGIVPMAGGNDGGGSIRLPAGHCGLFGFKPGRGRNPWGPPYYEVMHGAAVNHVLTRSVRDSAAMLDATSGPEFGAGFHIAPPERPYLQEVGREPGKLRIGFTATSPIGTEVHPEAVAAVRNAARLLESLGHTVEEATPAINGMQLATDFITMWFAGCAATVDQIKAMTGCGDEGFELDTVAMNAFGHASRASDYVAGYLRWAEYARQLAEFHQKYDFWMTPTMALPPARVGEVATPRWQQVALKILMALRLTGLVLRSGMVEDMARENLKWVPFTQLGNLTGAPGMSVPLHWTADGLPLGVQFLGGPGDEGKLFRLAGQLERAQPWADKRPPI